MLEVSDFDRLFEAVHGHASVSLAKTACQECVRVAAGPLCWICRPARARLQPSTWRYFTWL